MSGLLGLLERDGRAADEGALAAGLEAIDHRGPDGAAVWSDGPAGLGHCLRRTTPRPGEQPHAEGALAVAADARIDNRSDLVEALGLSSAVSDAGVLLAAYREWGLACPTRLVGAFSFGIWDADEGRLFCARDHAGIRPLFYRDSAERFVAASEIGAVLATDGTRPAIDEVRVADYLADVDLEVERTFYRDVRRLPPAHAMVVTGETIETWRYWSPNPDRALAFDTHEAYAGAFRELLAGAVSCRLEGPGTAGSMLSGGLDSSSIVCLAREQSSREDLPTYSFVFDELAECDERDFIDAVVEGGGVDPTFVDGEARGPLTEIHTMLDVMDGPISASNHHLSRGLFEAAEGRLTVILDGLGGDHTVSTGMALLPELARRLELRRLLRETRRVAQRAGSKPRGVFLRHVIVPSVPGGVLEGYRRLLGTADPLERVGSVIERAFAAEQAVARRARAQATYYSLPSTERSRHLVTLQDPQLVRSLEIVDHLGARAGVEPRFPFLDRRLMTFCAAVPPAHKLRDGWPRALLRDGLADVLPWKVRTRYGKTDLSPTVPYGLRVHDRERLRSSVQDPLTELLRYVDGDRFQSAFRDFERGLDDDVGVALWRPAVVSAWLA